MRYVCVEGISMTYVLRYAVKGFPWRTKACWWGTPTTAIGQVEEGVLPTCHTSILLLHKTHRLRNLSLCNSHLHIRCCPPIYGTGINRTFDCSLTSTSPKSINWHLKSSMVEEENTTPLQISQRICSSLLPETKHLFGKICAPLSWGHFYIVLDTDILQI